jgi:hypothetical protein
MIEDIVRHRPDLSAFLPDGSFLVGEVRPGVSGHERDQAATSAVERRMEVLSAVDNG